MTGSAHDVAAAIRTFQPNVPAKKLQKLLYYCQGHHLAATGVALFAEKISAYDRGPVVGVLWYAENRAPTAPKPGDPDHLDEAQLNTIGYVMERYGSLSGGELERMSHAEQPWIDANERRQASPGQDTITPDAIRTFFGEQKRDEEAEEPLVDPSELYLLTEGAQHRRNQPSRPDSITEMHRRKVALQR